MEHLRYSVSTDNISESQKQLFSYWLIGFVLLILMLVLIYLFPGQGIVHQLLHQAVISDVDLRYSLLFNEKNNHITYAELNKNPSEVIKSLEQQLDKFHEGDDIDILWLNYIILRAIVYHPNVSFAIKQQGMMQSMLRYFDKFKYIIKPIPDSEQQLDQLARDALSINQASYALYFYERLLALKSDRNLDFYKNVAKVALWANQCVKSAHYYFIVQHKSDALIDKRRFYFQALTILFQCNQSPLAIKLADQNIDGLSNDIPTYQKLVDLSIKGDEPASAQKYLIKLLELKHHTIKDSF